MAKEFEGRPFFAGELTGIRAFKVDGDAMLTGVVHEQRWVLGVNTATCKKSPFVAFSESMAAKLGMSRPPVHVVAGSTCQCGFYAYFKGRNSYMHSPRGGSVEGIVRGYGVVTVGSRGFRAERAHLVALIQPRPRRLLGLRLAWVRYAARVNTVVCGRLHHWVARLGRWALDHNRPKAGNWLFGHCVTIARIGQLALGLAIANLPLGHSPAALVLYGFGVSIALAGWAKGVNTTPALSPVEFELVASRYPGVPVYASRREATRAHPLTRPDQVPS